MAERSDVHVLWSLSPRIIVVEAPSDEIVMQDLVDTLRALEADLGELDDASIISAAGKEELGGGVTVGITVTLLNAQLSFEPRVAPLEVGTITTPDTAGTTLIDSTALFETNGVVRGSFIENASDGSHCVVLNVVSETELLTDGLRGGSDNQFDNGDSYDVYELVQCNISGGNLVAVDDVGDPLEPIFPSFGTQIVRTSSSSATLQELDAIQYGTYQNAVWVDVTSPTSGVSYPAGNREFPVNNLPDAVAIANEKGFNTLQILESMTINSGTNISEFEIVGRSHVNTAVVIDPAAQCQDVTIRNCRISGTLDGGTELNFCVVDDISYVNGHMHDCGLAGTITLAGFEDAILVNCHQVGTASPTIDMGGFGQNLSVTEYTGQIAIENLTNPGFTAGIGVSAGNVILDSTITAGVIIVSGIGVLTNNATSITYLNTDGLLSKETVTEITWDTVWLDTSSGVTGTTFPNGTRSRPVNNIADARAIAVARGLNTIHLIGSVTLDAAFEGYVFDGDGVNISAVDMNGQSVLNSRFKNIDITGNGVGRFNTEDCQILGGMTNIEAFLEHTRLGGTFTIAQTKSLEGDNCSSLAGATFNMNVVSGLGMANVSGLFTVVNCGHPSATIGFSGYYTLALASTCTAGTLLAAGTGMIVNQSTGMTITDNTVPATVWDQSLASHATAGTAGAALAFVSDIEGGRWKVAGNQMIFYKADNVTELARFDLKDDSGAPTTTNLFERVRA